MKYIPVGAAWQGIDSATGMVYRIWLSERREGFEVWKWLKSYSDGSHGPHDFDWGTSYQSCRRQMYLDGSNVKMKRVK